MADLRIFSYLPNSRLWKATIAARLCGVDVEIRGARPSELKDWLWDFDARPFGLYLAGIEQALKPARPCLVGDTVTLADICFVAELCLFSNERLRHKEVLERGLVPIMSEEWPTRYPRASAHFRRLAAYPAFAPDVEAYLRTLNSWVRVTFRGMRSI